MALRDIWCDARIAVRQHDSDWFNPKKKWEISERKVWSLGCLREGFVTVLREHGSDNVDDHIKLCLVGRSDIDENIASIQSNLTVFRVDDRRHRKDMVLGIINDWVYGGVPDDVQVSREMFFRLQNMIGHIISQRRTLQLTS